MLRADLEFGVLPREVSAVLFASEQSVYRYVWLQFAWLEGLIILLISISVTKVRAKSTGAASSMDCK